MNKTKSYQAIVLPPYDTPESEADWMILLNEEPLPLDEAESVMAEYNEAIAPDICDYTFVEPGYYEAWDE